MHPRLLTAVLLLAFAAPLLADAPGVYVITGGTVHPVSGPPIPNGVVVIRDGLIEAVGANVPVPADAMPIDAKGGHVYPGLFDAQTSLGFAPNQRPAGFGETASARRKGDPLPETSPAFRAVEQMKISDTDADSRRAAGVTTILTAPSFGIFNGQSVILNLGEGTTASRVIRTPAATQVSFNPRATWTYPDSLMGVVAYIRQTFLDAQHHAAAGAVYERNPAGNRRPEENLALEQLGPAINRNLPVVFIADTDVMIGRARAIATEFNLRPIISGARQAYRVAEDLRNIPVLVSVNWPQAPAARADREEQPLRVIRERQLAPTSPAALQKAGATFALVSGTANAREFTRGIRKAIENGLSADDALRAVTLTPARIFGVDRQLGSLERGKIANVVLTDKPIFDRGAKVTRVFVDGREVRTPAEDTTTSDRSTLDGTWNLTVRTSEGEVSIDVTLRAEGGRVSGTFSGDRGSGDIRNGTFDGTTVDFAISAETQQTGETSDWVFRGDVSGSSIDGTVSTTLGTFAFTGRKAS